MEEGLRQHKEAAESQDDTPGSEIAVLAAAGGGFDWLEEETELYDAASGEPV